jgi:NADPH2:quinone reductase
MRAIRVHEFGGPEVLKLEDVPDLQPGKGQVVVQVRAVGVNPVDAYVRTGTYAMKPTLPYTPGADAAGVVKSVGEGVTSVKPGDRVYTSRSLTGTYAEQTLCTETQVQPLPANVSFEQGAALGVPYATAYRALFERGGGKKSEEALIHGASGGVGTAAVQLAHAAGMLVTGTAGTDAGMKLVTEQGANHVANHAAAGYLDQLMQLTGGRGFDLIIEMVANKNLQNDLGLLAKKGRVVVVGNRGTIEINPRDAMSREADIRGMTLFAASDRDLREIYAALRTGLENGSLHPVIGAKLPLAEAGRAHEEIMKHSGALGKIVLTVG